MVVRFTTSLYLVLCLPTMASDAWIRGQRRSSAIASATGRSSPPQRDRSVGSLEPLAGPSRATVGEQPSHVLRNSCWDDPGNELAMICYVDDLAAPDALDVPRLSEARSSPLPMVAM